MSSIKLMVVASLVVPAALLLVFGPRPDQNLPPGRVIVDYWEKWTGNEEAQMRVIVDDFNSTVGAEKHIYVRYISSSNIVQKTLIATAAGVPPDVAGLWGTNVVQFAAHNAIEPLEKMAAAHGITASTYKPVFWKACNYDGHLYALISTPAAAALFYNKVAIAQHAGELRAAGLDPDRPPRSIAELDAYAHVLTQLGPNGQILQAGYLPAEPGWYIQDTCYWFGGKLWDPQTHRFTLTDPGVVKSLEWIQSYSKWLGAGATRDFQNGLGNFDSPQNAFLTGTVLMEQQGPWMANYIYNLKPSMSTRLWPKDVEMTKPLAQRLENYTWAAAPFPSAVPGLENVTHCDFDAMMIPKGAKHKAEAFEFIAYVNRQDVMEKLCKLHCKNSPLAKVSEDFLDHHPNPYIGVFEMLSSSPNAHTIPQVPIWPEVAAEMENLTQRVELLDGEPLPLLQEAQEVLQKKYDAFMEIQRKRGAGDGG